MGNTCADCNPGSTNAAGDDASGTDTACDATLCAANEYVSGNACAVCASGTTNAAGDDASGTDTACDATLCAANEYVSGNACAACAAGTTNAAGDDASGTDTACDATLCAADEYVSGNACVACEAGKTNAAGDDASGADTTCACPSPYSGSECDICMVDTISSAADNTALLGGFLSDVGCTTIDFSNLPDRVFLVHSLHVDRDVSIAGSVTLSQTSSLDADGVVTTGPVLTIDGGQVSLSDLTLTDGEAAIGAGIRLNAGTLIANNLELTANVATQKGGGLFVGSNALAILTDSKVTQNDIRAFDAVAYGAGVFVDQRGSLTLIRTDVYDNKAFSIETVASNDPFGFTVSAFGGGIYSEGTVRITDDSLISGNIAQSPGYGGGIAAQGGTLNIEDSTVSRNIVIGKSADLGLSISGASAIDASSAELTMTNSTVDWHVTGYTVIATSGGTFTNSSFNNNTAVRTSDFGSMCGVLINGTGVNIDGSRFDSNTATALSNGSGTSKITKSTFSNTLGNCVVLANDSGTGNDLSTLNVSESTFSNNAYGVILNSCGTGNARSYVNVVNSTFKDNTNTNFRSPCVITNDAGTGSCQSHMQLSSITMSGTSDTAICAKNGISSARGYLTVRNSLLIGHPTACTNSGIFTTDGGTVYNGGSSCAFGESDLASADDADTILSSALADNGGPTPTLALPLGSPAIDFGGACVDNNGDAITADQRGEARDTSCDAGAYEVQDP